MCVNVHNRLIIYATRPIDLETELNVYLRFFDTSINGAVRA